MRPLELGQEVVIDGVGVTPLDANHCPGSVMFLFRIPHARIKQAGAPREGCGVGASGSGSPDVAAPAAAAGSEGHGGGEGAGDPTGVAWGAGQGGEVGGDSFWQEQVVMGETLLQGGDAGGEPEGEDEESEGEMEEVLGFGKAPGRHLDLNGADGEPGSAGGRLKEAGGDGGCCGAGVVGMGAAISNGRAGVQEEEDGEESDDDVIMVEEEGVEQQEAGEGGGDGKRGQMGEEAKMEAGAGAVGSCGGPAQRGCASPDMTTEAQLRAGETYNVLHTGDCRWEWLGIKGVPGPRPAPKQCYGFPLHTHTIIFLPVPMSSVQLLVQRRLLPLSKLARVMLPSAKRTYRQQLLTSTPNRTAPSAPSLQVAAVDAAPARPGRRARAPAVP